MRRWLLWGTMLVAAMVLVVGVGATPSVVGPDAEGYRWTQVRLHDADGTGVEALNVRIADSLELRYIGLSQTEELTRGEGMLFVHEEPGEYRYMMRDMNFPLDILFVDRTGVVTTIHRSAEPEDPVETHYGGKGMYVLEVPGGYANETGTDVGDRIAIAGYPPGDRWSPIGRTE